MKNDNEFDTLKMMGGNRIFKLGLHFIPHDCKANTRCTIKEMKSEHGELWPNPCT